MTDTAPVLRARRWAVPLAAALIGLIAFGAALAAQRDVGLTRDEIVYMRAGSQYWDWWADLVRGKDGTATQSRIEATFGGPMAGPHNPEHPPLLKSLFGASEAGLADGGLGWTSRITAYRLPTTAMFGLLAALVVLFGARAFGVAEGVLAGVLVLLLPRLFFHAGLATFDAPMVTMWFAAAYAYDRALASRWGFVGFGLVFGLCLATKHNATLLPAALLPHYAWVAWRRGGAAGLWRTRPQVLLALVVIGPLVLVALWPWLWLDPAGHASAWMRFHLRHVHYNFEYLGRNWNAPPFPWHIALVTTALTVPVVTWVASLAGVTLLGARARTAPRDDAGRRPALLLLLLAAVAMGPFLLTTTPIFGESKHWMPAYPSMCLFAAIAIVWAARRAAQALALGRRGELATVVGLGAAAALASLAATVDAQPYALTHYNALAGGAPGGADLGMNRQFWGYAARGVLPWLNARAPAPGAPAKPVYSHDASPAWGMYRDVGLLALGLSDAGSEESGIRRSRFALVIHERHFNRHDYLIWNAYGTVQPAFVLTTDGVPIVSVYERPERPAPARAAPSRDPAPPLPR